MLMFRKHKLSTVHPYISVLLLHHISYVHAIQCALTQDEWNKASASLQCQEPNYYHCLKDDNGNLVQQCLQRVWIQNGMCPEFNSRVRRIDVFKCQSDGNNCPSTIFWSNAVYIYPICYEEALPTTTNKTVLTSILSSTFLTSTIPQMSANTTSEENKDQENVTIIISATAITILIVIIMILSLFAVYLRRKKRNRRNEDTGNINGNSSDSPIQLSEQRRENSEGEALIGNTGNINGNSSDSPIQLSEQRRENSEGEALIGNDMDINLYETPKASQTQQSEHRGQTNAQKELIDLTMNLMQEMHGVYILLILVPGRNTNLDESIVKKAAMKELEIAVDMENSFQKWTYNKTKGNYVFRDWIPSDGEYNETDLRKTQLEILQAIKRNRTKFVLVFPLNVWSQNTKLNDMGRWNICRQKTITHSAP